MEVKLVRLVGDSWPAISRQNLTRAYALHTRPRKSKIFGCSKTSSLAMPLFGPRFRPHVGTLVPHGKGGTLALLQVANSVADRPICPHSALYPDRLDAAVRTVAERLHGLVYTRLRSVDRRGRSLTADHTLEFDSHSPTLSLPESISLTHSTPPRTLAATPRIVSYSPSAYAMNRTSERDSGS